MSMLLSAFALSYLGMMLLCLGMNRHRSELLRADRRVPSAMIPRSLAAVCFGIALWLCIASQGGEIGAVIWLCLVMLAGVLLALLLAWRARWVLPLMPLLAAGAALSGLW
ncbi:hypothetical protein CAQ69_19215 [Stutzerimonas stutzeri]|nr:hypothetical protein CAQ69_19215 [Stutzerimonas stutzeri]